jgi:hypothetical protein
VQYRYSIPVFTPRDIRLFLKYFSSIDKILTQRFAFGFSPDEEHLTSLLCELLDQRGAELHRLEYSLTQLNEDLILQDSLLRVELDISTHQYNKYQERYRTQADLGIIISYNDNIIPKHSFRKGLLIQAKKLYPNYHNRYEIHCEYTAFDSDQHKRLIELIKHIKMTEPTLNTDCARYLLYNPQLRLLPVSEQQKVKYFQMIRENEEIFDYIYGLERYHSLFIDDDQSKLLDIGSIFLSLDVLHEVSARPVKGKPNEIKYYPFRLENIIEKVDIFDNSFAWFLVFGLLLGNAGCSSKVWLNQISGFRDDVSSDFGFVPPRYTMTISVSVGTRTNQG